MLKFIAYNGRLEKTMKYKIHDKKQNYVYFFDSTTGFYMRTGVLDENGKDTGVDPFMASFPHLIDVGIMGHCIHGESGLCKAAGIQCYQSGYSVKRNNMTTEDFASIAKQCRRITNQLALGGRGDPNQHENFEHILEICRENELVPNYTTSGFRLTDEQIRLTKEYCGAVAVSWYRSKYTTDAIERFIAAGCRTNIHYVLSQNTIDEAVERLTNNDFPKGVNAVIFLIHKPVGQGERENMITLDNPRLAEFCRLINEGSFTFKVGFDSCSVPMIINFCPDISRMSLDTCEGARYSCYISSEMVMSPCSFDREEKYGISLRGKSIREVWESEAFERFRDSLRCSCPDCKERESCMGGCPLIKDVALCARNEKHLYQEETL